MIAFRDVLIFAGLAALAAAVIASLFPAGEGVSPVPACSDCAFKLTGGYLIRQHGNYASLYLGTREAARYGWAYRADGRPLRIGENITCNPMYLWVMNGVVYVSCGDPSNSCCASTMHEGGRQYATGREGDTPPKFGRDVLGTKPLPISMYFYSDDATCRLFIRFVADLAERETVHVYVYDEKGQLATSSVGTIPGTVSFSLPRVGVYRVHIYASPFYEEWRTAVARVRIEAPYSILGVYTSNNTEKPPYVGLKIFDLTEYWKSGYRSVTVQVNPARVSFTLSAPTEYFADYLLAWEECHDWYYGCPQRDDAWYVDEVWRLTITQTHVIYNHIHSQGSYRHKVYADILIWDWPWGFQQRRHHVTRYIQSARITFCGLRPGNHDPSNCDALDVVGFVKECRWG